MARFQAVERPKETICGLIQKSMQKIKNKKGRVEGRRSKGVQKGLLREVLVKGVVTNLVKVANKELRFPREISKNYRSGQPGKQSPTPRLQSPSKSPQPKRWQSPPASTKRNLLKLELQNIREKTDVLSPKTPSLDSSSSPKKSTSSTQSPKKTTVPSPKKSPSGVSTFRTNSASPSRNPSSTSATGNRLRESSQLKRRCATSPARSSLAPARKRLKTSNGCPKTVSSQTSTKNVSPVTPASSTASRVSKIDSIRRRLIERQRAKTRIGGTVKRARRK